ncbi:hypothetical protein BJ508DRAFT_134636 [Ascobolus immersus RN42]|uniref:Uncharacterized protein n=1 Tax=Ascobolus immersus RN42 TaxID=1160509 RepID=A0A3N4IK28_ASCIM|nr:hypothetical protein BJ508DRAFT_134636 [Ascobolus immersus RN42]
MIEADVVGMLAQEVEEAVMLAEVDTVLFRQEHVEIIFRTALVVLATTASSTIQQNKHKHKAVGVRHREAGLLLFQEDDQIRLRFNKLNTFSKINKGSKLSKLSKPSNRNKRNSNTTLKEEEICRFEKLLGAVVVKAIQEGVVVTSLEEVVSNWVNVPHLHPSRMPDQMANFGKGEEVHVVEQVAEGGEEVVEVAGRVGTMHEHTTTNIQHLPSDLQQFSDFILRYIISGATFVASTPGRENPPAIGKRFSLPSVGCVARVVLPSLLSPILLIIHIILPLSCFLSSVHVIICLWKAILEVLYSVNLRFRFVYKLSFPIVQAFFTFPVFNCLFRFCTVVEDTLLFSQSSS